MLKCQNNYQQKHSFSPIPKTTSTSTNTTMSTSNTSAISAPSITRVFVARSTQTDPTTGTSSSTIPPSYEQHLAASTSTAFIPTSLPSVGHVRTTTVPGDTSERMETLGSPELDVMQRSPCGRKWLRQQAGSRLCRSSESNSHETSSSTDDNSITPSISCSRSHHGSHSSVASSVPSSDMENLDLGSPAHTCMNIMHRDTSSCGSFCYDCIKSVCKDENRWCFVCFQRLYGSIDFFDFDHE